ncbi:DUF1415 domain-containing protein [Shewanella eurypsychrophilus]|uniref:DUF1415 domain-containing protein n=1 Tax=Shewanella eurypsychrophilus TaxID=2593656 RepID=A0ABX6V3M5_9GAMM|nr:MULTISPECIES: DUF1415 domain-containing protein [Shewanella]QFU21947.1 DUF1415 family protein [Shewanella sp. YLB-09]QPG57236.1 DUF1415 domain-containing protein [Shewanella eurypsychrophilus]
MSQHEQDKELQLIAQHTQNWVERVIMKYNICPFARREVEQGSIRYAVIDESKMHMVLESLISECKFLDENPEVETCLFIIPRGFEGFYPYLDLVDLANERLIDQGYEGVYQLASMHPDYCFDGEPMDEPSNYTNRSPYPVLHIIREASMEKALADYNEPETIPERNIEFSQRKGSEFFAKLLSECMKK